MLAPIRSETVIHLPGIQYGYLRDRPAIIRACHLKLYHRDSIRRTAHDTQTTADTLLLVDDHISSAQPGLSTLMHRVALDHARESFHANAVVRTDVHAARAKNTD